MKRFFTFLSPSLLAFLFLVSFHNVYAQAVQSPGGFKNYVFGTTPDAYKNMTLEIEEGNTKLYSLNEPGMIDGVELEYVRLTFTKNKLSDISLQSKNATGARLLKNLKEKYGEPTRSDKGKRSHEWQKDKMQMLYETNASGSDATVSFSSKKV